MGAEYDHRREPEAEPAARRPAAPMPEMQPAHPVPVAGLAAPDRDPLGGRAVDADTVRQLAAPPPGRRLHAGLRRRMEGELQGDFRGVRVHDDAASAGLARSIGASAFTHGSDIYLACRHDPGTDQGRHLIAHELAHVAQQQRGLDHGAQSGPPVIGRADDPLEADAEQQARRVVESLRHRPEIQS